MLPWALFFRPAKDWRLNAWLDETRFPFRSLDLVAIPPDTATVVRPILIVQRNDRALSHAARGMLELIEARLSTKGRQRLANSFDAAPTR
jgi:hypothetical protein